MRPPAARRRWDLLAPVAALAVALLLPLCVFLGAAFLSGWKFQPIETGSMAPSFPPGSLAVVAPLDPSLVQPGMVVVFEDPQTPGRLIAHRAVKRLPGESPAWETKGDANPVSDPAPVSARAVRGRVRWAVPGLGHVVSALTGWLGVALLVGLPLTALLVTEVRAPSRRPRRPVVSG